MSHSTLAPELARALDAAERLRASAPRPPPTADAPPEDEQPWPGFASFTEELVQASRDLQRLRAAQDLARIEREEHAAREEGLRYALVQAWRVAAVATLAAAAALGLAVYAWWR